MLLRPDATYIDEATKRVERIFPQGSTWLHFESRLPGAEVFANSVLDPSVGIDGQLALKTFASADWQNWISSSQVALYELGTRIGLPPLKDQGLGRAVSTVYTNITTSLDAFRNVDNPAEVVPELLKNAGLQVLQQIAGEGNLVAQTFAQVLAAAVWAVDVFAAKRQEELAKHVPMPPLQSEDPATDAWQVNRVFEVLRTQGTGGVVFPDGGVEGASNADYTQLYSPAYKWSLPWKFQHREKGIAAQHGEPTEARGPLGTTLYKFDPGDGSSFGFMPGTTTTLRVLQASYRFYGSLRGTPVDRYTLRCRARDRGCFKSTKSFDGSRDCRQCVKAETVWPTEGIGWAYGGAPINVTTPGENVGAFYSATNKLLFNLLESIARPGPLLYTVDVERLLLAWRTSFENFWEFAHREWARYHGVGWRGQVSRLATLMTTFEHEGETELGGRDPDMPLSRIANPREGEFGIDFSHSIYSKVIKPYCLDLARMQAFYLGSLEVAYIPPGAGALYYPDGRVRRNELGERFLSSRKELLASNKRMLVDLRMVSDPEYRDALENSGVKPSKVNPRLMGSPSTQVLDPDIKPRRPPRKPKAVAVPPLRSATKLARRAPARAAGPLGGTASPELDLEVSVGVRDDVRKRRLIALGLAAGGGLATAAAAYAAVKYLPRDR